MLKRPISKLRHYQTEDGQEVRIYSDDGGIRYPVHGAYRTNGGWQLFTATPEGQAVEATGPYPKHFQLVETGKRILRERWVNVYNGDSPVSDGWETIHRSRETAAQCAQTLEHSDPVSCVKIIIDCAEGEGMDGGAT